MTECTIEIGHVLSAKKYLLVERELNIALTAVQEWMVSDVAETIILFVMCHMLGDYVLQSRFVAETKGSNWYHLFVHCVLYCVPFAVVFGLTWQLSVVFAVHFVVDPLKARWRRIGYVQDQVWHLLCVALYLVG